MTYKKTYLILLLFGAAEFIVLAQNQSVTFCPLYLALQNRCPTTSTTLPTTQRSTTVAGGVGNETSADDADNCGFPTINFCPATQSFLTGGANCNEGQTITVSWTTLREILANPSRENAVEAVGSLNANELASAFSSVAKTIEATPTQATIGVTFIPVGQIIGG